MKKSMKLATKQMLLNAWNFCEKNNKSTEFTIELMADLANVPYDNALDFMFNYPRTKKDLEL
ncbi:hypothetical protein [Lutibacter sp.]|uniref:hypothetical protein n=1 Tax=Lutibacter sp. TaxID=1925666 RepID=UPI003565FD8D